MRERNEQQQAAIDTAQRIIDAVREGEKPRLTNGWMPAIGAFYNNTQPKILFAAQHDDPVVVQAANDLSRSYPEWEFIPSLDTTRFLYVRRPTKSA